MRRLVLSILILVVAAGLGAALVSQSGARVAPDHACQASKLKAAAEHVAGLLKCHIDAAKYGVAVDGACLAGPDADLIAIFNKAEQKANDKGFQCLTEADAGLVDNDTDSFVSGLVAALHPAADASTCSAMKLQAVSKATSSYLKLYAKNRQKPNNVKFAQKTAQVPGKLRTTFARTEANQGCQTTADSDSLLAAIDGYIAQLVKNLWPLSDSGVQVAVPQDWQLQPGVLALGGPVSLDNFGGRYDKGGALRPGQAEINVSSDPLPGVPIADVIAAETQDYDVESTEPIVVAGESGSKVTYTVSFSFGPAIKKVVVFVPHGTRLYRYSLVYVAGDPQEADHLSAFQSTLDSTQFTE